MITGKKQKINIPNTLVVILMICLIILYFHYKNYYSIYNYRIDLEQYGKLKKEQILTFHSKDPIIITITNFLSNKECNEIIKLSKDDNWDRGYVLNSESENTVSKMRTNSLIWLDHYTNKTTINVVSRIASLLKLPIENAESIQLIKYNENEEYKHHYDGFNSDLKMHSNQRIWTALVYLSNVKKGGETDFRNLGITIKPEIGKIIIFQNCLKNTKKVHPDSLHAGMPVKSGIKYAFNLWFHEKHYRKL